MAGNKKRQTKQLPTRVSFQFGKTHDCIVMTGGAKDFSLYGLGPDFYIYENKVEDLKAWRVRAIAHNMYEQRCDSF